VQETASAGAGASLSGVRVVELSDEQAEYCGLLLAGLGAEVVKVERPGGDATRGIGPFYEDVADPERSLFFWNHNRGKRSVVLDPQAEGDRAKLLDLLSRADVFLESTPRGELERLGLGQAELRARFPWLIVVRMSPFGDEGPWADFKASDLVHLALGGPMMNSGYDPKPDGEYDTPPIAPQMWHAYHIAGEQCAIGIVAALIHQRRTGEGQYVSCAIHEAVAKNTELDVMSWVMRAQPIYRQTCRHAAETVTVAPRRCRRPVHPGPVQLYVLDALEAYGFCGVAEAGAFIADGHTRLGGDLPVNTNGGQLSEAYMWGWLHLVEAVRQLRGECGPRQVAGATIA
jgi:crotonobetainyl-CoA:carnitine CoA-transferase CaiB-like acyl-CoA transferase